MVANISVDLVAELANNRELPSGFELGWMKEHESTPNPVAYAIEKVQQRQERREQLAAGVTGLGVGLIGVFIIAITMHTLFSDPAMPAWLYRALGAFACLMGIVALLGGMVLVAPDWEKKEPPGKEEFERFAADLGLFFEWMRWQAPCGACAKSSDESLMENAKWLVVNPAVLQLSFQETAHDESLPQERRDVAQIEAGEYMAQVKRRYNLLQGFGFVSGGYGEYFKIAKQLRAQMAEKSAPEAA